jgi:hypothetical protein
MIPQYIPTEGNTYACPCSASLAEQRVYDMTVGCYFFTNYVSTCTNLGVCANTCCPTFAHANLWWYCDG